MKKRIILNALCILLILFSIAGIYFTVDSAKQNEVTSNSVIQHESEMTKPPEENWNRTDRQPGSDRHPNDMDWQQKPSNQNFNNNMLENDTYTLYRGGSNKGILKNNIYEVNDYIKGNKVIINNNTSFDINTVITVVK